MQHRLRRSNLAYLVVLNQINLQTTGDDFANRVGAIIDSLRDDVADPYVVSAKVNIVREGDGHMESRFFWFFVEDRASFQGGTYSYSDFMQFVQNPGGPGGPPAPPGAPRGGPGGPAPPMPPGQNYGAPPPPGGPGGPPPGAYGAPPPPAHSQGPPPPAAYGAPPNAHSQGPPPPAAYGAPPPAHSQGPPPPGPPQQYSQG